MKLSNTEAETQALITVLAAEYPETRQSCMGRLTPDLFFYDDTAEAYRRLAELTAQQGSIPGKEVFLNDPGLTDASKLLIKSTTIAPAGNLDDLDHLISQLSYMRKFRVLFGASKGILNKLTKLHEADEAEEDLKSLEDRLSKITQFTENNLYLLQGGEEENTIAHAGMQNTCDEVIDEILYPTIENQAVPSTFNNYDSRTGGYRKGDLVVLAAAFKSGKSAVKLNILIQQYLKHNLSVCDVCLEMNRTQELSRVLSVITGFPYEKIYASMGGDKEALTDQERRIIRGHWDNFTEHGEMNNCRFSIVDASVLTINQIDLQLKPFKYDVVAVDYVNLLTPEHGGTGQSIDPGQLSAFYVQLKQMAKRHNSCVIALTQADEKTGDIRYSKSAKEHCNVCWVWALDEASRVSGVVKVNQLAARSHDPFPFSLRFDLAKMTVIDHEGGFPDDKDDDDDD